MKHLANEFYIECDEYNYIINREVTGEKGSRKGKKYKVFDGFYSRPEHVHNRIIDMGMREYVNKDWLQCVEFVEEAQRNFMKELERLRREGKKV